MACLHPNYMVDWLYYFVNDSGFKNGNKISFDRLLRLNSEPKKRYQFLGQDSRLDNVDIYNYEVENYRDQGARLYQVPCGHCFECQKSRSKQWGVRLVLEQASHPPTESYFLTLTYDDVFLPTNEEGIPTCRIDDCSAFIKRLRRRLDYLHEKLLADDRVQPKPSPFEIKFFAASEYGETTARPHMHLLLYGFDFSAYGSYKLNRVSENGDAYFTSDIIGDCWTYGHHLIAQATNETIFYTARYCLKKSFDYQKTDYANLNIEPPNIRMSRRPGLGSDWIRSHLKQLEKYGSFPLPYDGQKIDLDRYMMNLIEEDNPFLVDFLKSQKAYKFALVSQDMDNYIDISIAEYNRKKSEQAQKTQRVRDLF